MPVDKKSALKHDNVEGGYKALTVESAKEQTDACSRNFMQYDDDKPLGRMLDKNPDIQVCVDIGCGLGWASDFMAKTRKMVYAIEPSEHAMALAQDLFSGKKNIVWMPGFAEDELKKLELDGPTFFNTLCVLSHLEDEAVEAICDVVDFKAPEGSVLSFSELWGMESHEMFWHTRTKGWWQKALPGFDLSFIHRPCQGRYKSFTGIKKTK